MASKDESREAEAKRKARYRDKLKRNEKSGTVPDKSHEVPKKQHIAEAEAEAEAFKKKTKARGTIEEVVEFSKSIGLPESDGEYLFHKWEGNGWTNGGSPVKNWKATIRSWVKGKFLPSQKAPAEKPGSSKSYLSSVNGYNERTDF
jgi:hypothetical protein